MDCIGGGGGGGLEVQMLRSLVLSLARVINAKFPLQPLHKYYITHYEELGFSHSSLRWKIDYAINSHYLTYFSLKGWENVLFELGSESVKAKCTITHIFLLQLHVYFALACDMLKRSLNLTILFPPMFPQPSVLQYTDKWADRGCIHARIAASGTQRCKNNWIHIKHAMESEARLHGHQPSCSMQGCGGGFDRYPWYPYQTQEFSSWSKCNWFDTISLTADELTEKQAFKAAIPGVCWLDGLLFMWYHDALVLLTVYCNMIRMIVLSKASSRCVNPSTPKFKEYILPTFRKEIYK